LGGSGEIGGDLGFFGKAAEKIFFLRENFFSGLLPQRTEHFWDGEDSLKEKE
jgi:hypothetical protein